MTALYVLGAFLLVLLAAVVLAPLLEREPPDEPLEELPPAERREAAVEALGELEFEFQTDKLPEEEYRRLRTYYGRVALAAEEEMETSGARSGEDRRDRDGRAVADRVDEPGSAAGSTAESGPRRQAPPGTCPECDAGVPRDARFCPHCGSEIRTPDGPSGT